MREEEEEEEEKGIQADAGGQGLVCLGIDLLRCCVLGQHNPRRRDRLESIFLADFYFERSVDF